MRGLYYMEKRELNLSMTDTARNSVVALPIISVFEVCMILRWFLQRKSFSVPGAVCNLCGYGVLLFISLVTLGVIVSAHKQGEKGTQKINVAQNLYAVLIVIWAVFFTFTGSYFFGHLDYLVYITIITIVPVFCFVSPVRWSVIQLISAGVILYIASFHDHFSSFLINFSVFTIISIVAGWTLYRVRHASYLRQIELEDERDKAHLLAYQDLLTGLPNRLSLMEKLDELQKRDDNADLILAMFDVNGLKKTNDALGHKAGDELLKGTADCMVQAFGGMGTIYRVGGDEFTGILFGTQEELDKALERLRMSTEKWKGTSVDHVSVSVGTASRKNHPDCTVEQLTVMADNAMYANKKAFYCE